jgi:SAM-dependent methyltransferase
VDSETIVIYERKSGRWVERRGEASDELGLRFRSQIGDGPILDAGCGAGRYLDQIGPPVVGVDATAAMLAFAVRRNEPLVRGDLDNLPFTDASFSGVFARHSYLHIPKYRISHALVEAARVLRSRGVLFMSLISGDYEGHSLPDDDLPGRWYSLWSEPELTAALTGAGFTGLCVAAVDNRRGGTDLEVTGVKV